MFARMCRAAAHCLSDAHQHQFNQGLLKGTLSRKVFHGYLQQDALYLRDFSKSLAIIAKRFANNKHSQQFALLSEKMLGAERNLHERYLGKPRHPQLFCAAKRTAIKNAAVASYTQHLFDAAKKATIEEAVASSIPCFWIYTELGKEMAAKVQVNNPYYLWIASYSSPSFVAATQSMIKLVDELGDQVTCPAQQQKMITAFAKSAKHELLFWNSVCDSASLVEKKSASLNVKTVAF